MNRSVRACATCHLAAPLLQAHTMPAAAWLFWMKAAALAGSALAAAARLTAGEGGAVAAWAAGFLQQAVGRPVPATMVGGEGEVCCGGRAGGRRAGCCPEPPPLLPESPQSVGWRQPRQRLRSMLPIEARIVPAMAQLAPREVRP